MKLKTVILITVLLLSPSAAPAALAATTSMRLLYPSFAGSWATAWIAKEAGYFTAEGLDVEMIRVGGSTRMVAAMLGGSDVVIIGSTGAVSPFRLLARPEIKQPADLKGKKAGITTFGSTSDQVVRTSLKHLGWSPTRTSRSLPSGLNLRYSRRCRTARSKSLP